MDCSLTLHPSAVGGHDNAIVAGNNFNAALFGGTRSYACDAGAVTPPFQAAIWSPYTTSGGSYQKGITSLVDFSFLIVSNDLSVKSSHLLTQITLVHHAMPV